MPGGNSNKGLGANKGELYYSLIQSNQHIDWWHDPVPGEDFLHKGNLITSILRPGIIYGLNNKINLSPIIKKCINIKKTIIAQDFHDVNERRKLNFGHSIAHAIESCFIDIPCNYMFSYVVAIRLSLCPKILLNIQDLPTG